MPIVRGSLPVWCQALSRLHDCGKVPEPGQYRRRMPPERKLQLETAPLQVEVFPIKYPYMLHPPASICLEGQRAAEKTKPRDAHSRRAHHHPYRVYRFSRLHHLSLEHLLVHPERLEPASLPRILLGQHAPSGRLKVGFGLSAQCAPLTARPAARHRASASPPCCRTRRTRARVRHPARADSCLRE